MGSRTRQILALGLAALLLSTAESWAAPVLKTRSTSSVGALQQRVSWRDALQQAIIGIQRHGSGGYDGSNETMQALVDSFGWSKRYRRPTFDPSIAQPSFCSGAVYAALLSAIMKWEEGNRRRYISEQAWRALVPQMVADGVGPWGYANANGPGFAMLVHRLGAGVNFTDWRLARPGDVMKIWWNEHIGGKERGHLVILVKMEGDTAHVWSSHMEKDGHPAGYGMRSIPKSAMARVLFTRITNPAAFNNAHRLKDDPWLTDLLKKDVGWQECAVRCGLR